MSADGLVNWFETIWRNSEGYVYLATKDSNGVWRKTFAQWPTQKGQVRDYTLRQAAQGKEVYYSPAIWNSKELSHESFKLSNVLWADFDGNAPNNPPGQPITLASAGGPGASDSAPPTTIPEPSSKVQSSAPGHEHWYWELNEPITDPNKLENLNRTLALDLGSDISVWNASRVLRPPETTNFGYGKEERKGKHYPVIVEETSERKYSADNFKETQDFRPLLKSKLGEIPSIQDVLAQYTWKHEFYELFKSDMAQGDRSGAMMKVAYYAAEAGFPAEAIYSILLDCDDRWGKYKNRTDKEQRLTDIVDRAIAKHPTAVADLTFAGLVGEPNGSGGIDLKSHYTLPDFMATEIRIDWILDGLLSAGGYGIIAGQPGIGKTQLALRLCEATATGSNFLEFWRQPKENSRARRTMFLSLEMAFAELQEFFKTMGNTFMQTHRENFIIAPVGEMVPFDKDEGRKYIERLMDEVRPEVLVVDSLANAVTGKLTDDDTMGMFNQYVAKLRQQYGCAVVFVHHNRKSQDKRFVSKDLDDLYGSRFLSKDAQFVFMVYRNIKDAHEVVRLNPAKVRFIGSPGEFLLQHEPSLNFTVEGIGDVDFKDSGARFGGLLGGESTGLGGGGN